MNPGRLDHTVYAHCKDNIHVRDWREGEGEGGLDASSILHGVME